MRTGKNGHTFLLVLLYVFSCLTFAAAARADTPAAGGGDDDVVNGYGIPVPLVSDEQIESLVKEWVEQWKTKQKPPTDEGGWILDDWGIWIRHNVIHYDTVDGFDNLTEYWLATNEECWRHVADECEKIYEDIVRHREQERKARGKEREAPESTADTAKPSDEATGTLDPAQPAAEPSDAAADAEGAPGEDAKTSEDPGKEGESSEEVPDLGGGKDASSDTGGDDVGASSGQDGAKEGDAAEGESDVLEQRPPDFFVPSSYEEDSSGRWGLVIALSGTRGGTMYLKLKLAYGCTRMECIFMGLKGTYNGTDYRWEEDVEGNVEYIRKCTEYAVRKYNISRGRIFLFGFSNGAHFLADHATDLMDLGVGSPRGFCMCEGHDPSSLPARRTLIVYGDEGKMNGRSAGLEGGRYWYTFIPSMGHHFPGPAVPEAGESTSGNYQVTATNYIINCSTMIDFLENGRYHKANEEEWFDKR